MTKKQIAKRNKTIFVVVAIFIIATIILGLFLFIPFINKIYPNIYVAGIYLGDKNKEEAEIYFKEKYKILEKVILTTNENKEEILTSEIISNIDYKNTVNRAYNYASSGNIFTDFINRINLIFKPTNLLPVVVFNEDKLLETLLIVSDKAGTKPVYPGAKKINGVVVINEGKDGIDIDIEKTRQDIGYVITSGVNTEVQIDFKKIEVKLSGLAVESYRARANALLGKSIELKSDFDKITLSDEVLLTLTTASGYSDEQIKSEILKISKQLNRSPQDSVFIVDQGKVTEFTPSKEGLIVDEDTLVTKIKDALVLVSESDKKLVEIDIPVVKTTPKIKNEDVNDLGINTLLGVGKSNFKGSIPNRIYNVNLAQSRFKGVLVSPGQIVSFNDILGDVSSYTGYKAAYVIKDGKTVLGDGGGVCQVSTTLFRAVLSAGLPVVERRAHAYRVGYYEQGFAPGLDATVYSPTTDFKFKNDTPAYLLIQPTINLTNLSLMFEIYGTSDGRVATTSKPIITSSIAPAEDLYVDDPTLPLGTTKQIEHRAYGAKVIFDYKVVRDGEELINQKFVSNYRPWQAVYLKGTKIN